MPLIAWNERIALLEICRADIRWRARFADLGSPDLTRRRTHRVSSAALPGYGALMSRLDSITDWPERARRAGYRVKALAADCGVSSSQLLRCFLEQFGVTPQKWLRELRLWHAAELLCSGRALSVKEIAAELGFASEAHFCRAFKSYHECTASQFVSLYATRLGEEIASMKEKLGPAFNKSLLPPPPWVQAEINLCSKFRKCAIKSINAGFRQ